MATQRTVIEGGTVVLPDDILHDGYISFEDETIVDIGSGRWQDRSGDTQTVRIDASGRYVAPGFIDIHVHGGQGGDAMDATIESLYAMCQFHATHGTTMMLPTTITVEAEELLHIVREVGGVLRGGQLPIHTPGIHVEGPFINARRRGAHRTEPMRELTQGEWQRLRLASDDTIRWMTLAPEIHTDAMMIPLLREAGVHCSIGHSDATYEEARASFAHGITHATHFGNAMRPFHHRDPGVVGAVLASDFVTTEVIADGIHLHPGAVDLLIRTKGPDRVALITDAMRAAGMPDGEYELGGERVRLFEGAVSLADGTLAGSSLTMDRAVWFVARQLHRSVPEAVRMASLTPARILGCDGLCGSLAPGKRADILLLDDEFTPTDSWVSGQRILLDGHWCHGS